jgi:DNA invertase Pin-like site-specific DNA recombinase
MKYIIYCRKSSEGEDRQAQSLETQMTILDEYSKRCDLTVVDRLEESRSAKKLITDRCLTP